MLTDVKRPPTTSAFLSASSVALLLCAVTALAAKLLLALRTYGTNDVYAYESYLAWARPLGVDIYSAVSDFNHPPSVIHVLRFLGWLTRLAPLPFGFWLRLLGTLADAGTLCLVWSLLKGRHAAPAVAWALPLMAIAPVSLMVSGFHGNTDPVMVFFLVLSVWLTENGKRPWIAGAALGLSMCFKVVPVIVLPVMFMYHRGARQRLEFFGAWGLVLLVAWQPFLVQDPVQIYRQVFGYRSAYGIWGVSYLADHIAPEVRFFRRLTFLLQLVGAYGLLALCVVASFWMNHFTRVRPRLFAQVGFVFLLFLAGANGFGVQYLVWLVPWVVPFGAFPAAVFYTASGMFLFGVYDYWSQGMPWYLADANRMGLWPHVMEVFQMVTWMSVLLMLYLSWRAIRAGVTEPANSDADILGGSVRRVALAAAVAGSLAFVLGIQVFALQSTGSAVRASMGPSAIQPIRTRFQIQLSRELYARGRLHEAIAVTEEALKADPSSAHAYDNLASLLGFVERWDDAMAAAREALRLEPDFASARNSLAWNQQEKANAAGLGGAGTRGEATSLIDQSLEHFQSGRFKECMDTAAQSLRLAPTSARSFATIGLCAGNLHLWDEAIRNMESATRLEPAFPLLADSVGRMERLRYKEQH